MLNNSETFLLITKLTAITEKAEKQVFNLFPKESEKVFNSIVFRQYNCITIIDGYQSLPDEGNSSFRNILV